MNKKQKSLTNKGFSLVELIIVIAIMAVLVGVLAPQFLKYVERSRKSTDVQNVQAIVTAVQTYAADPMATSTIANGTITLNNTSTAVAAACSDAATATALTDAGIKNVSLKSKEWYAAGKSAIVLKVEKDANGNVTVTEDTTTIKADHSITGGTYK